MPCYGNDVLKQEYQGMLICGRQKTFKGSTIFPLLHERLCSVWLIPGGCLMWYVCYRTS